MDPTIQTTTWLSACDSFMQGHRSWISVLKAAASERGGWMTWHSPFVAFGSTYVEKVALPKTALLSAPVSNPVQAERKWCGAAQMRVSAASLVESGAHFTARIEVVSFPGGILFNRGGHRDVCGACRRPAKVSLPPTPSTPSNEVYRIRIAGLRHASSVQSI